MSSDKYQILHMAPNFKVEGGQVLLLRSLQAGDSRLFSHHVAVPWRETEEPLRKEFDALGAKTIVLNLRRSLVPLTVLRLVTVFRLVTYVRRHGIDLIHTNTTPWDTYLGLIVGRLTGRPVVNTFHTMRYPATLKDAEWGLFRGVVRVVTAVSAPVIEDWQTCIRALGIDAGDVRLIHPGVSDRFTQPVSDSKVTKLSTELGLCSSEQRGGPVLTIVARLVEGKGHEHLPFVVVSLVERYPHLRLLVVGEGPLRQDIEESFRETGVADHVTMLGNRSDIPEILAITDLFILPSRGEGFGLAVLEAMASGVPVVAFDIPSLHDFFVDGEYGRLTEVGSAEALADAAALILGDAEAYDRMAQAARRAAGEFSIANTARALERVWREVIDDNILRT